MTLRFRYRNVVLILGVGQMESLSLARHKRFQPEASGVADRSEKA